MLVPSSQGYVLFDDTLLDKRHGQRIELVRRQYLGNAHATMKGIGLVNCVYVNPETEQVWLVDYRLFAPQADSKSKLDHVAERLTQLAARQLPYRTVLMESCYAPTDLFKQRERAGRYCYCPLQRNRVGAGRAAALSQAQAKQQQLEQAATEKLAHLLQEQRRRQEHPAKNPQQAAAQQQADDKQFNLLESTSTYLANRASAPNFTQCLSSV